MSVFPTLLRLGFIVVLSTVAGALTLKMLQFAGAQVPYLLVGWLPRLLGSDGEAAYDAALLAFLLECNGLGLLGYFAWRRFG
tara:strand:+ start:304 stop:549 length:246 start_codon:yes stop_codon:yes gene_type:complete